MEDAPDIVLMDVNLAGGREGIEAARWLREVCDIPIVFVTAYTDHDTVERIHEQVPDAPVIAKPLYRERLASAVAGSGGVLADAMRVSEKGRRPKPTPRLIMNALQLPIYW